MCGGNSEDATSKSATKGIAQGISLGRGSRADGCRRAVADRTARSRSVLGTNHWQMDRISATCTEPTRHSERIPDLSRSTRHNGKTPFIAGKRRHANAYFMERRLRFNRRHGESRIRSELRIHRHYRSLKGSIDRWRDHGIPVAAASTGNRRSKCQAEGRRLQSSSAPVN